MTAALIFLGKMAFVALVLACLTYLTAILYRVASGWIAEEWDE